MKTILILLLASGLVLSGCGWRDSRINPFNWGGGAEPVAVDGTVNPLIPARSTGGIFSRPEAEDTSVLIANVTELRIDPTPSGAIILVEGVASRQGAFASRLRPVNAEVIGEDGLLDLEFRVSYPSTATAVGSPRSRTVLDAYSLTTQQLAGVRLVRVRAAENALESRRR